MHKLTKRLEEGADEKLELRYGPDVKQPYDKKLYKPINKVSFLIGRDKKFFGKFKNPFPDLIDTIELADNYLVNLSRLKNLKFKGFGRGFNKLIVQQIYYDRYDRRFDIVLSYLDNGERQLLNEALERASKERKSLEAKKDIYLLYLFDE